MQSTTKYTKSNTRSHRDKIRTSQEAENTDTIKTKNERKQPKTMHAKTPAFPKRHQSKSLAVGRRKIAADTYAKRREGPSMATALGGRERDRGRRKEDDPRERVQSSTRG